MTIPLEGPRKNLEDASWCDSGGMKDTDGGEYANLKQFPTVGLPCVSETLLSLGELHRHSILGLGSTCPWKDVRCPDYQMVNFLGSRMKERLHLVQ